MSLLLVAETIRVKTEHFSLKIGSNKPSFCQNIDNFWL